MNRPSHTAELSLSSPLSHGLRIFVLVLALSFSVLGAWATPSPETYPSEVEHSGALPAADSSRTGIGVEQLSLSGVTLVESSEHLKTHLGRPVAVHRTTDSATGEPAAINVFPRLTAYLVDDEVMRLKTTDPDVPTLAGARVGDSVGRVLDLYDRPAPRYLDARRLELSVSGTGAVLVFHLTRGKVAAIESKLDY